MNYPSLKKLQTIPGVTPEQAKAILEWLAYGEGERTRWDGPKLRHVRPCPLPALVESWVRSCSNAPSRREIAHAVIASIITEGQDQSWDVFQPQEEWVSIYDGPAWECVDVGDPYIPTLIRRNDDYLVMCWGDLPEVNR